jgi:uncharacterized protein
VPWASPGVVPTHLLYLHGFRSSPQSAKARRVMGWLAAHRPEIRGWCPQLPPSPRAAMDRVEAQLASWESEADAASGTPWRDRLVVIGSSLGGFYATWVAERTGCRAVLLNPAVNPARDLAAYIGEQTTWHGDERFFFEPCFVDELRAMNFARCRAPERLLAVIAQGDEVLDWREMVGRYPGSTIRLLEGSDHALSDFDDHLDAVLGFLGLTPS